MNIKKTKEFILYSGASLVALIIDLMVFTALVNYILVKSNPDISILLSTIIARLISGTVNFLLSKKALSSKNLKKRTILKYFALGALQLLSSAGLVILIRKIIKISKTIIKLIVDGSLYLIFYKIQISFIFRKKAVAIEN